MIEQYNKLRGSKIIGVLLILIVVIIIILNLFLAKPVEKNRSNNDLTLQNTLLKNDTDGYIYALNQVAEAKKIYRLNKSEIERQMDFGNTNISVARLQKEAIFANDQVIPIYSEINLKYKIAINKLETLGSPELKDAIFDLKQALLLLIEQKEQSIKFFQNMYTKYVLKKEINYQNSSILSSIDANNFLKTSFAKIDKIASDNVGEFMDNKTRDEYINLKYLILSAD